MADMRDYNTERKRITPLFLRRNDNTPGKYHDGGGLSLIVKSPTSRSWILRYSLVGRAREMGLGKYPDIGLAAARELAEKARELKEKRTDPLEQREADEAAKEAAKAAKRLEEARRVTFKEAAERYIDAHRDGWHSAKHAAQWGRTLAQYAYPIVGDLPVQAIDDGLVIKMLEPIWKEKTETASRLRGRIESVLNWATFKKYRTGENPARWRGHLENQFDVRSKVQRVEHHAALPYAELPTLITQLRQHQNKATLAMEFTILTVARSGETLGAKWGEINLTEKMWIVPAERMKAKREHRVPLCVRALTILEQVKVGNCEPNAHVFSGRRGKPLGAVSMRQALQRMGRKDVTVHGFRSTFRDWCAEQTSYPSEVAEMALAHAVSGKVEAAYRRGDMFEKRRQLAEDWCRHCAG
jgi:integrase